jgi:hypothetical protein
MMPSTKRALLPAVMVVVAAVVLLQSNPAHAYCLGSWGAVSWPTMPVRLHAQLQDHITHSNGTPWTRAELERSVRIVLARLNHSAGADIPLLYLDTSVSPSNCAWLDSDCNGTPNVSSTCAIANAVHILPSNCELTQTFPTGGGTGYIILFQASDADVGPKPWDHSFGAGEVFERALLHELGHDLGLGHPNACSSWSSVCPAGASPCAVMMSDAGNSRSEEYFMPDDRAGLRALYSPRPAPTERQFESSNLDSGAVEWSVGDVNGTDFFAVSSRANAPASTLTLAGYRRDVPGSPVVYSWNWSNFALTNVGNPWDHFSNGPIGAAQSTSLRYVTSSTYRMTADSRRWRRVVSTSSRPIDLSSGWTTVQSNPAMGSLGDTVTAGISSVYDSAQSTLYHVFRSNTGQILLQAGTSGAAHATGYYSEGTPSIACAPVSGLDCLVVSVEPGYPRTSSTAPRLRWFKTSWNASDGWTVDLLHTEPWIIQSGDPQVAAYKNGSTYEYVVTYRWMLNSVTKNHLLRMNAVSGTDFDAWSGLPDTTGKSFMALGSTQALEMFHFSQ